MNRPKALVRLVFMALTLAGVIGLVYIYSLFASEAARCYQAGLWGTRLVLSIQCEGFVNYTLYLLFIPGVLFCCGCVAVRYRLDLVLECIINFGWMFMLLLIMWALVGWMHAFIPTNPSAFQFNYWYK